MEFQLSVLNGPQSYSDKPKLGLVFSRLMFSSLSTILSYLRAGNLSPGKDAVHGLLRSIKTGEGRMNIIFSSHPNVFRPRRLSPVHSIGTPSPQRVVSARGGASGLNNVSSHWLLSGYLNLCWARHFKCTGSNPFDLSSHGICLFTGQVYQDAESCEWSPWLRLAEKSTCNKR